MLVSPQCDTHHYFNELTKIKKLLKGDVVNIDICKIKLLSPKLLSNANNRIFKIPNHFKLLFFTFISDIIKLLHVSS